jgi:hypothetical protein
MESFFSLLQKNVLDTQRWDTREELRLAIVVWIETKYNRRRRQRGLGKLTRHNLWEAFDNSIGERPIRRIDFTISEERAHHDEVVRLARELEQATIAARGGLSASDRSLAARRVEALIEQLDEVVLDLYGITGAEERASILALGAPFE